MAEQSLQDCGSRLGVANGSDDNRDYHPKGILILYLICTKLFSTQSPFLMIFLQVLLFLTIKDDANADMDCFSISESVEPP